MLVDDAGATLVEYSLVLALISGICIFAVSALGVQIHKLFSMY